MNPVVLAQQLAALSDAALYVEEDFSCEMCADLAPHTHPAEEWSSYRFYRDLAKSILAPDAT